jgi:hypothetical protein
MRTPSRLLIIGFLGLTFGFFGFSLAVTGCDSGGSDMGEPGRDVAQTFSVTVQEVTSSYPWSEQNGIGVAYAIDGETGKEITLERGETYEFVLNYGSNHPFYVGTNAEGQGTGRFSDGVETPDGNNTEGVSVFFTVPSDAPSELFYQCGIHVYMGGKMNVTG